MDTKLLNSLRSNPTPANIRLLATLEGKSLVAVRRKLIVDYVRSGKSIAEAAEHFGVTTTVADAACLAAGIELPRPVPATDSTAAYPIIADVVNGLPDSQVAKSRGVTKQRVHQIRKRLLEAGCRLKK